MPAVCACGVVRLRGENAGGGAVYPLCEYLLQSRRRIFVLQPEDWLRAEMQGEIVALVHSHPGGLPWLSEADRRLQIKSALSWWLVCRGEIHKFRCVPHLTGRRFEHGVTDCYTLFRDAIIWRELICRILSVRMTGGATVRTCTWTIWRRLVFTGFPLPPHSLGDILLCCFGASVAIMPPYYCGNGELLHHLPEQLSKRERYSEKWQRRTHSAWRHRHWHVSASRGFTTIWPPPQPVCEHGSGSHPCPVDADAGISPSDERRLVPDTYSR